MGFSGLLAQHKYMFFSVSLSKVRLYTTVCLFSCSDCASPVAKKVLDTPTFSQTTLSGEGHSKRVCVCSVRVTIATIICNSSATFVFGKGDSVPYRRISNELLGLIETC